MIDGFGCNKIVIVLIYYFGLGYKMEMLLLHARSRSMHAVGPINGSWKLTLDALDALQSIPWTYRSSNVAI